MKYASLFVCGLILLAIFYPPWLICVAFAWCRDRYVQRRMRAALRKSR